MLPVELTMPNDLPIRLAQPVRGRVRYGEEPLLFLYFLDQNAWPPEPEGMWVSGGGRADVIVRTVDPIDRLVVEAESPIATELTVSMGRSKVSVPIGPGKNATFDLPAQGVRELYGYAYMLSVTSSDGFVPRLSRSGVVRLPESRCAHSILARDRDAVAIRSGRYFRPWIIRCQPRRLVMAVGRALNTGTKTPLNARPRQPENFLVLTGKRSERTSTAEKRWNSPRTSGML